MPADEIKTVIKVKVIPQARRNQIEYMEIDEMQGRQLIMAKIRLTAAPQDNAANEALINLLSKKLKLKKSSIDIISGHKNRNKSLIIHGINAQVVLDLFNRKK